MSRENIVEVARKYLIHGLVEHRPEMVPFAENCWRIEQGLKTGEGAENLREVLLREDYKPITGISNEKWVVEVDQAVVFFDLHLSFSQKPFLVAERFLVQNGLIREIEAILYMGNMAEQVMSDIGEMEIT
jgi:hypothetical protein